MPEETDDATEEPMGMVSRVLTSIAGLGFSTAGGIAVFVKDTNVAGVPLLVLGGAAFLYVALTGQRLIQVSKDGVTFAKVRGLERTLREASSNPEMPDESKELLADIAEDNGVRLLRRSEAELEASVRQMLERLARPGAFEVAYAMGAKDYGTDFVLTNTNNRTLAIEVKGRIRLSQFAAAVRRLRGTSWDHKMLLVDGGLPEEFVKEFRREGVWIVEWKPDSDDRFMDLLKEMEFVRA